MLCHKDVNLPETLKALPPISWELEFTSHAIEQAYNKDFTLPCEVRFSGSDIIEAELKGSTVTKLVVRVSYDNQYDICLVLRKQGNKVIIVTAWLNYVDDDHSTLREELYQ